MGGGGAAAVTDGLGWGCRGEDRAKEEGGASRWGGRCIGGRRGKWCGARSAWGAGPRRGAAVGGLGRGDGLARGAARRAVYPPGCVCPSAGGPAVSPPPTSAPRSHGAGAAGYPQSATRRDTRHGQQWVCLSRPPPPPATPPVGQADSTPAGFVGVTASRGAVERDEEGGGGAGGRAERPRWGGGVGGLVTGATRQSPRRRPPNPTGARPCE